jgi:hypothetical protein
MVVNNDDGWVTHTGCGAGQLFALMQKIVEKYKYVELSLNTVEITNNAEGLVINVSECNLHLDEKGGEEDEE